MQPIAAARSEGVCPHCCVLACMQVLARAVQDKLSGDLAAEWSTIQVPKRGGLACPCMALRCMALPCLALADGPLALLCLISGRHIPGVWRGTTHAPARLT